MSFIIRPARTGDAAAMIKHVQRLADETQQLTNHSKKQETRVLKNIFIGILSCCLIVLCNCAILMKKSFLNEPIMAVAPACDIRSTSLKVIDQRKNPVARDLNVPFISLPGNYDMIEPVLTDTHIALIESTANICIRNTGMDVDVVVEVVEGRKEFSATAFYEKEYVKTDVKIILYNEDYTPYFMTSTGEAFYEFRSADASPMYIEKLFRKSLKASILKAFKNIEDMMKDMRKEE